MRTYIRTSRWAIWARRFAGFSFVLLVLSILLHRLHVSDSATFVVLLAFVSVIALCAVLFAILGYVRIWNSGDHGWGKSTQALLIGGLCLVPAATAIALGAQLPTTAYVTTNWSDPPPLLSIQGDGRRNSVDPAAIAEAFPAAVSRTYRLDPATAFRVVRDLVNAQGWRITVQRNPTAFGQPAQIGAVATTLLGFEDEVSLTLTPFRQQVRVDMTSASSFGVHDLGTNGRRVESFLIALDEQIALGLQAGELQVPEPADSGSITFLN